MLSKVKLKENWSSRIYMFVWTSGFQNPLAHTHFNMFVDEWTSANESPDLLIVKVIKLNDRTLVRRTDRELV